MPQLFLAANEIPLTLDVFSHLQIVVQEDSGNLTELEVQSPGGPFQQWDFASFNEPGF